MCHTLSIYDSGQDDGGGGTAQRFAGEAGYDLPGRLLGANHLAWCAEALPPLLINADRTTCGYPVERVTINALHTLWGETWTPRLSLGQRLRADEADCSSMKRRWHC